MVLNEYLTKRKSRVVLTVKANIPQKSAINIDNMKNVREVLKYFICATFDVRIFGVFGEDSKIA